MVELKKSKRFPISSSIFEIGKKIKIQNLPTYDEIKSELKDMRNKEFLITPWGLALRTINDNFVVIDQDGQYLDLLPRIIYTSFSKEKISKRRSIVHINDKNNFLFENLKISKTKRKKHNFSIKGKKIHYKGSKEKELERVWHIHPKSIQEVLKIKIKNPPTYNEIKNELENMEDKFCVVTPWGFALRNKINNRFILFDWDLNQIGTFYRKLYEIFTKTQLDKDEDIHHLDGNKFNNTYRNLIALPKKVHIELHKMLPRRNYQKNIQTFTNMEYEILTMEAFKKLKISI